MTTEKSLYERLGGAEGVKKIAHALVDLHCENDLIKTRFLETDLDALKELARTFLSAGSGGPDAYEGKDMTAAHRGMNINEAEYLAVMDDGMKALDVVGVDDATRNEVLGIFFSFKEQILFQ